jgi:hypothetical protein
LNQKSQFGEVIGGDTRDLVIECHALYGAPTFGAFVRAECRGSETHHFAVVARVATGPFDSNRVVQAHRMPPGELEAEKPHLADLLRTVFEARVVGHGRNGVPIPGTPPLPPRLHCYVYPADLDEIHALTATPDFLRPLTTLPDTPTEDLLVAAIRAALEAWPEREHRRRLVEWGRYLARLLQRNYMALEDVLSRVSPAPVSVPVAMPAPVAAPAIAPIAAPTRTSTAPASRYTSSPEPRRDPPKWEEPIPLTTHRPIPDDDLDPFESV